MKTLPNWASGSRDGGKPKLPTKTKQLYPAVSRGVPPGYVNNSQKLAPQMMSARPVGSR